MPGGLDDFAYYSLRSLGLLPSSLEWSKEQKEQHQAETVFSSGNPHPMTNLPPEVLANIMSDFQGTHGMRALASCCLVSRALLPHARRALYSSIALSFRDDDDHLQSYHILPDTSLLARTLSEDSNSSKLVGAVEIRVKTVAPLSLASRLGLSIACANPATYRVPDEWIEEHKVSFEAVVLGVLHLLPNLLSLDFTSETSYALNTSFLEHARLNNLRHLSCRSLQPSSLAQMPQLEDLVCSPGAWSEEWEQPQEDAEKRLPPPALRRLDFYLREEDDLPGGLQSKTFFSWAVSSSLSTLEDLSISFNASTFFVFDILRNLRSLRIRLNTLPNRESGLSPAFSQSLTSLPSSLTYLDIKCDYCPSAEACLEDKHTFEYPSSLEVLKLDALVFRPNALLAMLKASERRLPRLKLFKLRGRPTVFLGMKIRDVERLWEDEHWEKVVEVCEEKGIACKV